MTITPERIAELRKIEAKMTPGPWDCRSTGDYGGRRICRTVEPGGERLVAEATGDSGRSYGWDCDDKDHADRDANGIAAMRNAFPELLDEVERLRAEVDTLAKLTMKLSPPTLNTETKP